MISYEVETLNDTLTSDGSFEWAVMTMARCLANGPSAYVVAYVDGVYSVVESRRAEEAAMDLYLSR